MIACSTYVFLLLAYLLRDLPLTGEKIYAWIVPNLGARIGDAVVSAISADQRLARSPRIRCAEDSARYGR